MKKIGTVLLILIPLLSGAQQRAVLSDLLATSSPSVSPVAEERIDLFIHQLKPESNRSNMALLRKTFHQVEKTFLHEYSSYARFDEIFSSGRFDCLTATALFATVLERLNFDYRIVETNYHIFILVRTTREEVLLETTDRFGGFVRGKKAIEERIDGYSHGTINDGDPLEYHFSFNLCHAVNIHQLPGLLYYNQAVKEYNNGGLERCADLLVKAQAIYDTPRINEFETVLLKTVAESNLNAATKQRIIKQVSTGKPTLLASR